MEVGTSFAQSFGTTTTARNETVKPIVSSDFETFLKMLTVQMKNQDPLDPVKSEDYSVQLATFSGVEQQVMTNELLTNMISQLTATGMAQYAGWVGMEVRAPMPAEFSGEPIVLSTKATPTADTAFLSVTDSFGNEVQRVSVPPTTESIQWTGVLDNGTLAPAGNYSFTIESYSAGEIVAFQSAEVYARVVEARSDAGQTTLVTAGGVEIPTDSVSGLREPVA
jgi:flagellar basal-body rod modification protein FlgD